MHKSFKTVDVIHLKGEKCMSKWSGRYEDTKESERSLEEDIIEAGLGRFCYPTESGGAVRKTDTRIDVYAPSDSSKGHSHTWHNGDTNETGDHD